MASLNWFILSERDLCLLDLSVDLSSFDFDGGFRNAASPQSIYYQDGSLWQFNLLVSQLARLDSEFPDRAAAETVFDGVRSLATNYEFHAAGDLWRIQNTSVPRFHQDRFKNGSWFFVVRSDTNQNKVLQVRKGQAASLLHHVGSAGSGDFGAFFESNGAEDLFADRARVSSLKQGASNGLRSAAVYPKRNSIVSLGHAGLIVTGQRARVAIDPIVTRKNGSIRGMDTIELIAQCEAILISHAHWDHVHYQTLAKLPRSMRLIVPKVEHESFFNPPLDSYLKSLGFHDVESVEAWDNLEIDDIRLTFAPLIGEPFGLGSSFDGLAYVIEVADKTAFGTVDSCHDENGTMIEVVERVSELFDVNILFCGCSDLRHSPSFSAGSVDHLSNELSRRPDLVRFHPDYSDVLKYDEILKPESVIPYAGFVFNDLVFNAGTEDNRYPAFWSHLRANGNAHRWQAAIDPLFKELGPKISMLPMGEAVSMT